MAAYKVVAHAVGANGLHPPTLHWGATPLARFWPRHLAWWLPGPARPVALSVVPGCPAERGPGPCSTYTT